MNLIWEQCLHKQLICDSLACTELMLEDCKLVQNFSNKLTVSVVYYIDGFTEALSLSITK